MKILLSDEALESILKNLSFLKSEESIYLFVDGKSKEYFLFVLSIRRILDNDNSFLRNIYEALENRERLMSNNFRYHAKSRFLTVKDLKNLVYKFGFDLSEEGFETLFDFIKSNIVRA